MSEDNLPPEYTPMADAYNAEPKEEKETFTSDIRGIEKAADALEDNRAAEKEIVERKYKIIGGEHHGEDVPPNHTLDLRRAVEDLTRQRNFEHEVDETISAANVAEATDAYRAEKAAEQAQVQQQPEPQPQTPPEQALPPGVDPEIAEALIKNPRLRQAVEQEVIKADQARIQYANATQAAAQVAVASVLAQYPEIQGISAEQLPAALQVMAAQNPQRAAEVASHLQRAEQIYRLHEQARGQNAAIMNAQLQHWAKSEDQKMDSFIATQSPETVRSVKENLIPVMAEKYGISKDDLAQAFATTPLLRAEPFQRALFDLVRHHVSNAAITDKKFRDAPPVQRPGVRSDRQESADDAQIARAHKAFLANPNPKNASALILAKRNAGR